MDFVDGVTVVSADFLDRIQEVQAGLATNMALAISGTSVVLNAGTGNSVSSLTIGDKFRYVESPQTISFTGSDASGSYGIWATTTATDTNPSFTLVKVAGSSSPSATYYRLVGTVDWNGSTTLSNLVQVAGYNTHAHMHVAGVDPLPVGSITASQIADGTITLSELAASLQQLLVPTGTIMPYAGASAPSSDYLLCDGAPVSRTTYSSLFTALGGPSSPYGLGNGSTTFNVPDLRGRVPMGAGTGLGPNNLTVGTGAPSGSAMTARNRGEWGGEETHLNKAAESGVPAHVHPPAFGNNFYVEPTGGPVIGSGTFLPANLVNNPTTGNNLAQDASSRHNNVQPFVVTNYIIKT